MAGTDGHGRWGEINGAHRPELDGCLDIDLAVHAVQRDAADPPAAARVGDEAELPVATVDVETLAVVPVEHATTAPSRAAGAVDERASTVEFDVDEYGLVIDLPDRFRRTEPSTAHDAVGRRTIGRGSARQVRRGTLERAA